MRFPSLVLGAALALALVGCRDGADVHLQRARDAVFEKRSDEALVEYRKALDALKRDEGDAATVLRARALKGAADVYWLEQRKVKEAVAVYKELVAACPESPEAQEARLVLAELLRVHYRDLRGAIDQLTAALERNPPDGAALQYEVAELYFALQDFKQCELEASRLAERFPNSEKVDDALLLRAQALAMVEETKPQAAKAFADLRARFPASPLAPYAHFELGRLKADAGEYEKAIEHWVETLKTHPQPGVVQDAIARARRQLAATPEVLSRAEAFAKPKLPERKARNSAEAVGANPNESHREGD